MNKKFILRGGSGEDDVDTPSFLNETVHGPSDIAGGHLPHFFPCGKDIQLQNPLGRWWPFHHSPLQKLGIPGFQNSGFIALLSQPVRDSLFAEQGTVFQYSIPARSLTPAL